MNGFCLRTIIEPTDRARAQFSRKSSFFYRGHVNTSKNNIARVECSVCWRTFNRLTELGHIKSNVRAESRVETLWKEYHSKDDRDCLGSCVQIYNIHPRAGESRQ